MPESHQTAVQQAKPAEGAARGILSVAGIALGEACFGAVAGYVFLPHLISYEKAKALGALLGLSLDPEVMFWLPAALGAAIGGIGGIIGGHVTHARQARRIAGFRQTAESLGAQSSPASVAGLSDKLGKFFPESSSLEMHNVIQAQMQGIRIAVGDVSFLRETGIGTDRRTQTVRQPAAYYESDSVHFPKFTLQPEGYLLNLVSGVVGIQDMDFPAHPEFSRAYHLTAVHAENTRRLFNDRLLEGLSRRQGYCVASDSGSLVIHRAGKLCKAEELKGFVSEAAEIFRLFEDSARTSGQTAEAVLTAKVDVKAVAEKMPGLIGNVVRETLVTRADVDAFIRQPLPRTIPANILRYSDKFAPGSLRLIGIMFTIVGAAFGSAYGFEALSGGMGLMSDNGLRVIVPLVFLGVGGCITYFAGRTRIRIKRLLRNGQTCAAKIEKIDATGESIGNVSFFRVTVQFQAEGRLMQASCRIMGDAVQRAQRLAVAKKPAPILYDPANPQRILFVEALLNVSPEYEK